MKTSRLGKKEVKTMPSAIDSGEQEDFRSCRRDDQGNYIAGYLVDLINGFLKLCTGLRIKLRKSKDGLWGEPVNNTHNGK